MLEPQAGTFPADQTPMLAGLVLDLTTTNGSSTTCTLGASSPGPASCNLMMPVDTDITVTLDPSDKLPDGFISPAPFTFSIPNCDTSSAPVLCPQVTQTIELPGTWRQVGLTVTNAVTAKPVEGATYDLCSPPQQQTQSASTAAGSCPAGTTDEGSATSDANGSLTFPGLYRGDAGYSVVATTVPAGYQADATVHAFAVPAVTDLADVGTPYAGTATLAPLVPTLGDDTASGPQNAAVKVDVLANDKALGAATPAGSTLTVGSLSTPAHGAASVGADGTVTYTPTVGYVGTDSFTYTATNAYGGSATATVTVTLADVPPTLAPVSLTTQQGKSVSFKPLATATAAAGNTLSVSTVGRPGHGKATMSAGRITYTPAAGFSGKDSFTYSVSDGKGGTATTTVKITVKPLAKPDRTPSLPYTGGFISAEAAAGGGLLGLGVLLLLGAVGPFRRRRAGARDGA